MSGNAGTSKRANEAGEGPHDEKKMRVDVIGINLQKDQNSQNILQNSQKLETPGTVEKLQTNDGLELVNQELEVEEEDELFNEMTKTVSREICNFSVLEIERKYKLLDISMKTTVNGENVVGEVKLVEGDEESKLVWLPTCLVNNFNSRKVLEFNHKIQKGANICLISKGKVPIKYGNHFKFSAVWSKL